MKTTQIPEYDFKSLYPYTKTLSSSQVLKYLEDPKAFYLEYVFGVRRKRTPAMTGGVIFAAAFEMRDKFDHRGALKEHKVPAASRLADLFDEVLPMMPVVPSEVVQIADFKGWKFRATLDGYVEEEYTIIENKTGQKPWTQERANFDNQMSFQAWVHLKLKGVLPKRIILNWVNTSARAQKKLQTFRTSRSMKNLKNFERLIELVIEGIEAENWSRKIYG